MNTQPVNAGTRLAAMILDHIFMTFIAMLFYLPVMIANLATGFKVSHDQDDAAFMSGPMMYVGLFGFALYFCKDMFNGRSISKRLLKLQLVDNKTGEVASPLQCLVRNIFLIIWPVEFIVALANTGRRIGDRVAGTRLVYYDRAIHSAPPDTGKMILSLIISYGLILLIPSLLPTVEFTKTNFSKTSYNEVESRALEQSINGPLGKNLTADIRIYDTVLNTDQKYISAIINLRKNYIEHDVSYRTIHDMVTHLIYQRFPKETFTGKIQYVFRGQGQFQSRSTSIGTTTSGKPAN
jgi:uncharacterized RDD family membrane protein YckC